MYAEVFAAYSVLVFLLFYLTEISNKKPIGIIAAFLIMLLGLWVTGDDTLYLRTGENTTIAHTVSSLGVLNTTASNSMDFDLIGVANSTEANNTFYTENTTGTEATLTSGNTSNTDTVTGTENVVYNYVNLSTVVPYIPISLARLLGLVLIGLGFYLAAAYAVDTFTQPVNRGGG